MKRLLSGTIAAIITFAVMTKYKRNITEYKSGKYGAITEEIVWMDDPDAPYFDIGDEVYLRSPHSNAYWCGMEELEFVNPYKYTIIDVRIDEDEDTWRYKLKPNGHYEESEEWYSEDWLEVANKSTMRRKWVPDEPAPVSGEYAEIDYWLDTLRYSTDVAERAEANRRLTELTGGDSE